MRIIFISCITVFMAQLGITMYLPAVPIISMELNGTQQNTSLALVTFLVGMAALMLVWGSLSEKYGRKTILLVAIVLYIASSIGICLVNGIELFILLRLVQGLGAGGMSVMARVLIKDQFNGVQLAKSLSWLSIAFVFTLGIGQYFGSILLALFGWRSIFGSLAGASVILLGVISLTPIIKVPLPAAKLSSLQAYSRLLTSKDFMLPTLIGGLGYGTIIVFNTSGPFLFQNLMGWSFTQYGQLGWLISLAYFMGSLIVNRNVVRTGNNVMLLAGICIIVGGSTLMLVGGVLHNEVLLWLPYCFAVFGQAMSYPTSLAIANDKAPIASAHPMVLCGFLHQLMAAMIGTLASQLPINSFWAAPLLMFMLSVTALMCMIINLTGTRVRSYI
ncbi:MFS transporter [Shewanella sp. VB17]|uniref:MFS transporter n=1 Tax=Shewanella sp. VB17 TaxID=2739432 RepID=UPI0015647434|nr:MFS transporter [Shewanella sp. VB17]NRD74938.1 MFS transporter [Shewanella sp. VB17]